MAKEFEEKVVVVKLSYFPEEWVEEMGQETLVFLDSVIQALK